MKKYLKRILMGIALASLTGIIAVGCGSVRGGYETAPYQVVRSSGKFELRNYPALVLAETPTHDSDNSFSRLFRFIGGNNVAKQKIAMTTPVYMTGEKTNATMAFVMPKNMSAQATPTPNDPGVSVREIRGGQFAVLRFCGGRSSQNETNALAKLHGWLVPEKLVAVGEPVYGYFDPPWTPTFLRRNEVMLRVAAEK